jgi:ABC-type branched-subunit amino acid transport system substrate-binding protein/cytochrome c553
VRGTLLARATLLALIGTSALTGRALPSALPMDAAPEAELAAAKGAAGSSERGRSIYQRGLSASGKGIEALLGSGGVVPATALPCINCHGRDGRGKPEGGVTPSNVRWASLTRPYDVVEASGRAHPPYTEHLVGRAVTMGFDAAGRKLDDTMPRYRFSRADLADLLAYLKTLGTEEEPGLDDVEIRIGMVLAATGPLAPGERAARALVGAYFESVNHAGGVYGRLLALRSVEAPEEPLERAAAISAFLDRERPFALAALSLGGPGEGVSALLEERRVPVVGAVSPAPPRVAGTLARYVFHLYSGPTEQGEALARFAATMPERPKRAAVVYAEGSTQRETARRIVAQGGGAVPIATFGVEPGGAAGLWPTLARDDIGLIFFLGPPGEEQSLWKLVGHGGYRPSLLSPAALAGDAWVGAPASLEGHLFAAYPALPSDRSPEALAEALRLTRAAGGTTAPRAGQLDALAAAMLLVEGLKRSGRELHREALVDTLESLRALPTGLTPPLTYGPNRRIGALGAYVVAVDPGGKSFVPRAWIALD